MLTGDAQAVADAVAAVGGVLMSRSTVMAALNAQLLLRARLLGPAVAARHHAQELLAAVDGRLGMHGRRCLDRGGDDAELCGA